MRFSKVFLMLLRWLVEPSYDNYGPWANLKMLLYYYEDFFAMSEPLAFSFH